jgi:hypothetical protein
MLCIFHCNDSQYWSYTWISNKFLLTSLYLQSSKFFIIFKILCTCELYNNETAHITYYVIFQLAKSYCSSKLYDMKTWASIMWSSFGQNLHSTSQIQKHSSHKKYLEYSTAFRPKFSTQNLAPNLSTRKMDNFLYIFSKIVDTKECWKWVVEFVTQEVPKPNLGQFHHRNPIWM